MPRAMFGGVGAFALLACACNDSSAGSASDTGAPPDVVADSDGASDIVDAIDAACPIAGTWRLGTAYCGNDEVTASLANPGGITDILVVVTREATGACRFEQTFSGPTCMEVETRVATVAEDGTLTQVSSRGVTSCLPAACTFNANDLACALGDRAEPMAGTTARLDAGNLVLTSPPGTGFCRSLAVASRLVLEPGEK